MCAGALQEGGSLPPEADDSSAEVLAPHTPWEGGGQREGLRSSTLYFRIGKTSTF